MSGIAENLRKLMSSNGINTHELSQKTGVNQSVLHRILTGETKNPSLKSITPILDYFSVSLEEISCKLNDKWHKGEVPVISWSEATHLPLKPTLRKSLKFVKTNKKITDEAFALTIEYNIHSLFPKGALIIINPSTLPKNRNYVLVQEEVSDLASLKYYIIEGNSTYLKSLDPDLPTLKFEEKKFRIIGVVVQLIFDFD